MNKVKPMAHVLLIEDNSDLLTLWAEALEDEGFDVRTATSGVRGVEIAGQENFDVVVTDILMPDKDGIETLLAIRRDNPNAKTIVVSGGGATGNTSFLEMAEKLGASATMQKPVDLNDLTAAIRELASTT